ncbi:hypothetical protein [Pseudorhodoferax sp. Leaf265]|uniref:hypothetical protein n=1 Tax=Pseudorhodoferax sp. Leaf265 TaxID=1736315 RepID=UPI0012E913C4|nr:hypothetical protein [Pseudorhodoferax sp. Leaf265]
MKSKTYVLSRGRDITTAAVISRVCVRDTTSWAAHMTARIRTYLALFLATFAQFAFAQSEPPASAPVTSPAAGIGYSTVQDALVALKATPGVQVDITKPDGWVIVNEPGNIQWSFTPSTHAAYPAVVRRAIKINSGGEVYIEMSALCQAEKAPCDKLIEDFKGLNEQMRNSI